MFNENIDHHLCFIGISEAQEEDHIGFLFAKVIGDKCGMDALDPPEVKRLDKVLPDDFKEPTEVIWVR